MQIKVKDTRMHKYPIKSTIEFEGQSETKAFKEVPVAEVKLVLVECNMHESLIYISKANDKLKGLTKEGVYFEPTLSKFYKPILISETEKIEADDWRYSEHTSSLIEPINRPVFGGEFKVLALPEHFSPKHLQAIVDGKMKDGDKVLVECELFITEEKDEASDMDININAYKIKLNSSNHITLHKVEEKMYPLSVVEKAFDAGASFADDCWSGAHDMDYKRLDALKKEWFEQNVK